VGSNFRLLTQTEANEGYEAVTLGSRGSRTRCLLVWASASLALLATWRATRASVAAGSTAAAHRAVAPLPLDRALADLAAAVLLGCALWLWLATTAVVLEAARGRPGAVPARSRFVPAGVRRLVLAACGVAVASALAQPAFALPTDVHLDRGHHQRVLVRSPVDGLPLPERATVSGPTGPRTHAERDRPPEQTVVIRSGDSLWAIAAGDLPPASSDAAIAARWHAIYAANRARIGPDPDLIVPGVRLLLPGKDTS
jgi:hypothetical protein